LSHNNDHGAKITSLLYLLHEDYAGSRERLVQSLLKSLSRWKYSPNASSHRAVWRMV